MADRSKLLFVNADGDFEESSVADSLKYASFKTANYELTDALLGDVTNLMIKSDGSRAFAADQSMGGFKLTNLADGTADSDAINFGQLQDAINGFDWKDSVRAATTAALPASTYDNGSSGVGATLTADANGALPAQDGVTLVLNDRILVKNQADAEENGIYYVSAVGDGSNPWELTRALDADSVPKVSANMTVSVEEGTAGEGRVFQLSTDEPITIGTSDLSFIKLPFNALTGGAGISISGEVISTDLLSSGGLKHVGVGDAAQLAVEPADFAGDGLVDDGSDNLAINWATDFTIDAADDLAFKASDLASTASGEGASIVGIEDAGGYYTGDSVEEALQELGTLVGANAPKYTVGAGGVTKGDLVYLSANNTVLPMPINAMHRAIGVAMETVAAAGEVEVQGFDRVVPGAISGATAGTRYYWDGSALTTTMPSAGGAYVWQAGIAKNATDLLAAMEFVKKNS